MLRVCLFSSCFLSTMMAKSMTKWYMQESCLVSYSKDSHRSYHGPVSFSQVVIIACIYWPMIFCVTYIWWCVVSSFLSEWRVFLFLTVQCLLCNVVPPYPGPGVLLLGLTTVSTTSCVLLTNLLFSLVLASVSSPRFGPKRNPKMPFDHPPPPTHS